MICTEALRVRISSGQFIQIDRGDWESPRQFNARDGYSRLLVPCEFSWRYVGDDHHGRYVRCSIGSKPHYSPLLHRVVMEARPGQCIDHRFGDTLDMRRSELRFATRQENACNAKIRGGASRFKGVAWNSKAGFWRAQIGYKMERFALGNYATEEDAARAYDAKATELFGEFARLNFPDSVLVT